MVFLLCRLMKHLSEVTEHQILKVRTKKAFPELSSEKEVSECYNNVLECIEKSQYVSGKKKKVILVLEL